MSKTLQADQDDEADGSQDQSKSREEHDSIVASYKELIREQVIILDFYTSRILNALLIGRDDNSYFEAV